MLILTEEKGSRHLNSICFLIILYIYTRFPGGSAGKESTGNAGDPSLIPGLGRSAGGVIGYPLQYSWASLVAQLVKNLPALLETWVRSPGLGRSPEKESLPTPVFWSGEFHGLCGVTKTLLSDFHFHLLA